MTLGEKVAVLETRLRRQRIGMIGMALGLAGTLFIGMAQKAPTEMSLEGLTIMKDGKPRIALGTNPADGNIGIGIMDAEGKVRLGMGTDQAGGIGIAIMDSMGAPRVVIGESAQGAGIMLMGATLTELPAMPAQPAQPDQK
ncbi:MAG: hypothetical protein CMJ39_06860 [Phycisphaerae bacterium]|nr:hypothetical protein [Phycisphaerae bacterium]